MRAPFTNIHIHVFNAECAPENFLRIMSIGFVRRFPRAIKSILQLKISRKTLAKLNNIFSRTGGKQNGVEKYVSFLDVGLKNHQSEIYDMAQKVAQNYGAPARVVALTLDMDHMDDLGAGAKNFETQLAEVIQIKRNNPASFFPFLGVDPRTRSGSKLVAWAKKHLENGCIDQSTGIAYPFFSGIKIYPGLGFFPFDPALQELYAYAEQKGIPIMSHCTRHGSKYVGSQIESLIPDEPQMIAVQNPDADYNKAKEEIIARIKRWKEKGWVKNSKIGNNDKACALFGHPQNYVPIMKAFPQLKMCLAHMGGSDEMVPKEKGTKEQKEVWEADDYQWATLIQQMMPEYNHLYTDISYTLSDLDKDYVQESISVVLRNTKTQSRVLFGTDFYMTEREAKEPVLYQNAKKNLASNFENLARENCLGYLGF